MYDLAFADAARPTPVVVLKLPLRAYSLGHELLLLQRRNPLLMLWPEDFNQLPFDNQCHAVSSAVIICCDTFAARLKLEIPSLFGWRIRWHQFKIWLWQSRVRAGDVPLAIAEFRNYLAAGRSLPPTPDPLAAAIAAGEAAPEAGGRALGSPLLAGLINFASSRPWLLKGGSVMDVPFGYAAWLYFADMESEGRIKIENQKELEVRLETEQAKADALAEEEAEMGRESRVERREPATAPTLDPSAGLATPPPDLTDTQPSTINRDK